LSDPLFPLSHFLSFPLWIWPTSDFEVDRFGRLSVFLGDYFHVDTRPRPLPGVGMEGHESASCSGRLLLPKILSFKVLVQPAVTSFPLGVARSSLVGALLAPSLLLKAYPRRFYPSPPLMLPGRCPRWCFSSDFGRSGVPYSFLPQPALHP